MGVGTNNNRIATVQDCNNAGGAIPLADALLPTRQQIESNVNPNYRVSINGYYAANQLVQTKDITYHQRLVYFLINTTFWGSGEEVTVTLIVKRYNGVEIGRVQKLIIHPEGDPFGGGEDMSFSGMLPNDEDAVMWEMYASSMVNFSWTFKKNNSIISTGQSTNGSNLVAAGDTVVGSDHDYRVDMVRL